MEQESLGGELQRLHSYLHLGAHTRQEHEQAAEALRPRQLSHAALLFGGTLACDAAVEVATASPLLPLAVVAGAGAVAAAVRGGASFFHRLAARFSPSAEEQP